MHGSIIDVWNVKGHCTAKQNQHCPPWPEVCHHYTRIRRRLAVSKFGCIHNVMMLYNTRSLSARWLSSRCVATASIYRRCVTAADFCCSCSSGVELIVRKHRITMFTNAVVIINIIVCALFSKIKFVKGLGCTEHK
jgi:hypothetical protein